MQSTAPDPQAQAMALAMLPFIGIGVLVIWAIVIIPFWQIFKKAGMAAPLSLLMLLPFVNLVMLYVLAFSRWKVVPAPDFGAGYLPPQNFAPGGVAYPGAPTYPPPAAGPNYTPAATSQAAYPPPPPPPPAGNS
jgi:Zn-dependent protease with chaperone function